MPPPRRPDSAWGSSSRSQDPPSYHSTGGPPSYRTTASSAGSRAGEAPPSFRTPTSLPGSDVGGGSHPSLRSSHSRTPSSSYPQFTPVEPDYPTAHSYFSYKPENSPTSELGSASAYAGHGYHGSETSRRSSTTGTRCADPDLAEYRGEAPNKYPACSTAPSAPYDEGSFHQCPLLEVNEVIRFSADWMGLTIRSVSDIPEVLRWSATRGNSSANRIIQLDPESWFTMVGYNGSCTCGRWGGWEDSDDEE